MSEDKSIKLIKAVKELNIGMSTIVDFLATKGYKVDKQPMAKLDSDMYSALLKEFAVDKSIKEEAKQISIGKIRKEEPAAFPEKPVENRRSRDFENEEILIKNTGHYASPQAEKPKPVEPASEKSEERNDVLPGVKVVGKIDLNNLNAKPQPAAEKPAEEVKPVEVAKQPEVVAPEPQPEPKAEAPVEKAPEAPKVEEPKPQPVVEAPKAEEPKAPVTPVAPVVQAPIVEAAADENQEPDVIRAKAERLTGPNVIGKIQLPVNAPKRNPVASSSNANSADHKRKRKRKDSQGNPQHGGGQQGGGNHQQPQQGQGQNNPPPAGGTINPNRPDFRNRGNGAPGNGGPSQGGGNRPDFRNSRNNAPQNSGPKKNHLKKIYKTRSRLHWPV
jgi:translation initiation factor IF-2